MGVGLAAVEAVVAQLEPEEVLAVKQEIMEQGLNLVEELKVQVVPQQELVVLLVVVH